MKQELAASFDRQRKDGVEIIKYGNPLKGIDLGTAKSVLEAAVNLTAEAKREAPKKSGYLRNSIMWRTEDNEGGFNS